MRHLIFINYITCESAAKQQKPAAAACGTSQTLVKIERFARKRPRLQYPGFGPLRPLMLP
ncbi:MAG TPA: hypothetical protein DIW20_09405 [Rhodospirillaceae bacterium]|nr:hypothetical protein [Rhodospirillaceae bacterium]